ncbi:hypothetical protein COO60DRAFT_1507470 [Scenedesmus sp. NREL 46B-D3]|nr:hypothetical protein COO60DRAFT_1507470 [Scenedesmus sp. NREL 46B-D3]
MHLLLLLLLLASCRHLLRLLSPQQAPSGILQPNPVATMKAAHTGLTDRCATTTPCPTTVRGGQARPQRVAVLRACLAVLQQQVKQQVQRQPVEQRVRKQ